ncbi:unnamed protein product [Bemisia tabaci]|uniref:Secreted protein n=1 Tax=Bemisia tabaci TaxID=7038 RepID=A0A9P0F722_BEMTA|nr:unnamed protein product [Bemisia tabaci]
MRNIHLFSLSVVMLLRIRGSEARYHWKHDGGWFYTDKDVCQKERCDPWYGVFKEKGTEDDYKSATTAKKYRLQVLLHTIQRTQKDDKTRLQREIQSPRVSGLTFSRIGTEN